MLRFLLTQGALALFLGSAGLAIVLAADLFGLDAMLSRSPDRFVILPAIWAAAMGPFTVAYVGTAMALQCWER
jgi:hypothetical protein